MEPFYEFQNADGLFKIEWGALQGRSKDEAWHATRNNVTILRARDAQGVLDAMMNAGLVRRHGLPRRLVDWNRKIRL